jgi:hypothetical protein
MCDVSNKVKKKGEDRDEKPGVVQEVKQKDGMKDSGGIECWEGRGGTKASHDPHATRLLYVRGATRREPITPAREGKRRPGLCGAWPSCCTVEKARALPR